MALQKYSHFDKLVEFLDDHNDRKLAVNMEQCRQVCDFDFMFIALIWKIDFVPFMVLIITILNDGTIMTISKDRVKSSPQPDS
ncbi:hypothetical protein Ahy_A09g045377 [Arachis hypogaea]|uniref:Uncharacterized protein n=1 Tax=Arachis hypogaea TaxID=3818 RepID=A0A445BM74_ARAHY|nr:hypothetical protein Ahy_A09g045377 [Arachis hypogaea]